VQREAAEGKARRENYIFSDFGDFPTRDEAVLRAAA
jgi:hypothetical protein